ncbi:MAG: hypothetical protein IT261_13275, partial [Saprospiraceae bacterium]|nr:hypothetical protein [Saprospiraceae bacterium]
MLFLLPWNIQAQETTILNSDFTQALVTPKLLRDSAHVLHFDAIRSDSIARLFEPAKSPYLTFGADASDWWLSFTVKNELPTFKTLVLWLNRKNFDSFTLLQQKPD